MLTVKDGRIKPEFFSGDSRAAFNYIYDIVMETGEVPTVRAFKRQFPRYKLETVREDGETIVGTEENLKFWCSELKKKVKQNFLADAIEKVAENLQDYDAEKALKNMRSSVAYIDSEVEETTDVDITKDTESRKEAYLKKKQTKGMIGISTGFNKLDYLTKGLKDGTLTIVIANTGVGKTMLEVIMGANMQLHNYRVLQGVTEMSEELMRDRYEAMLFSMCYGVDFSYNAFKSGSLSLKQEKMFFEFLENDLPNFEPLHIVTATGVLGLAADIEKYNPDVVMIDSAYLMEDDQGAKDDWLRVAHISRDLKKLAKRTKKPILINTQATKNTSKKVGPAIGDIMYTQALSQDADDIWALFRDEIMIQDKEMALKILKQREGTLGKIMLNWNFDTMDFSEIYADVQEIDNFEEESNEEKSSKDNTLNVLEED